MANNNKRFGFDAMREGMIAKKKQQKLMEMKRKINLKHL